MEKIDFNTVFNYVDEKFLKTEQYQQAIEEFKKEGFFNSEKEFMSHLTAQKSLQPRVYKLIKTFKNPDWNIILNKLNDDKLTKFVIMINKDKLHIDLASDNWKGLMKIWSLASNYQAEKDILKDFLQANEEQLREAFLTPGLAQTLLNSDIDILLRNYNIFENHLNIKQAFDIPEYQKLLVSKKYLRYQEDLNNQELLSFTAFKNADESIKNVLASTLALNKLDIVKFKNDDEQLNAVKDLLNHPDFTPDLSLLSPRDVYFLKTLNIFTSNNILNDSSVLSFYKDAIPEYLGLDNANCYNKHIVEIAKLLIEKNIISLNELNDYLPYPDNYNNPETPFAGRLLLSHIKKSLSAKEDELNNETLIKDFNDLETMGVCLTIDKENYATFCDYKSYSYNKKFMLDVNHYLKSTQMFNFVGNVSELSNILNIPPVVAKELVDFFDKRYNHTPVPENNTEANSQTMQWDNLIAKFSFVSYQENQMKENPQSVTKLKKS